MSKLMHNVPAYTFLIFAVCTGS